MWVLGLISGSAADAAGLQQGDQLLELNGRRLAGQSPFEVASLLQGPEQEEGQQQGLGLENPAVQLKASGWAEPGAAVCMRASPPACRRPPAAHAEGLASPPRTSDRLALLRPPAGSQV